MCASQKVQTLTLLKPWGADYACHNTVSPPGFCSRSFHAPNWWETVVPFGFSWIKKASISLKITFNEENELFIEEFPFVKDCQDIPDAFLLNADDLTLEDTLITQWYQWNIKIYDNSTMYLDENRISDVNDLINGYFFTTKLFDNHLRLDNF